MFLLQGVQLDGELDVRAADDVLDLEVLELDVEPHLLDDPGVSLGRHEGVVFALGPGAHNLA